MLAVGLTILVFAFWTMVGYAVLTLLYRQNHLLQNALLSPVVGIAVTLLPVFWLNRLGIPVGQFGIALTIALTIASISIFWFVRPKFPWRDYLPFAIVFVIALFLTGRPMLEFGLNWASFSNPDQVYYTFAAQRFLNNGYFQPLGADQANGQDYSFIILSLQSQGHRTGSDLLLAWGLSITGLRATQAYMPMILAFHLSLVSSLGALILQAIPSQKRALLGCIFLSISALTTLGTLYQLLAQVSGLALLTSCIVILMRPADSRNRQSIILSSLLSAILISALLIVYPEVFPFLLLAFLLYTLVCFAQKHLNPASLFRQLGLTFTWILIGSNTYLWDIERFFNAKLFGKIFQDSESAVIFPYYLVPSGLADLWGLKNIAGQLTDPWLSINILLGGLLLVITFTAAAWLLLSRKSIAAVAVVMISFGVILFIRKNDFGLFKLAMFSQPFLIGTLVVAEYKIIRHHTVTALLATILCVPNLLVQSSYVQTSKGGLDSGLVEISKASASNLYTELEKTIAASNSEHLILENVNVSLTGLLFLYAQGKFSTSINLSDSTYIGDLAYSSKSDKSLYFTFDVHNRKDKSEQNVFSKNSRNRKIQQNISNQPDALLVAATPQQGLFNRWRFQELKTNIVAIPLRQVRNHLVFIPSKLGNHYYGYISKASFYQLESDFFIPSSTIAGLGQHLLFEVLNPSEQGRLVLNMTASLKSDRENKLPPANAIGKTRELFPIVGRGSARVFSAPVAPQVIDGGSYVAIDMGVEPKAFPNVKTGLMKLYGAEIAADSRKLVGFGRDISLISPQEYAGLTPPNQVSSFPTDLTNRNLEYSGVYEDGWLSEAAFFGLLQPDSATPLVIKGTVPRLDNPNFTTELRVLVEGKEVAQRTLKLGEFNLKLTLPKKGQKRQRVDLRFSKWQNLPNPDKRPVAAKLSLIGFTTDEKS